MVFVMALAAATALFLSAQTATACPEVIFDDTGTAQTQADLLEALTAFDQQVTMADANS
jgi:hypothetical protein